ncbi:unknown [Choristoneura fumiferana DEF multiple nucleopolyhedrovirus]|uniref:Uncharacterized protein n=1 Tax=Choristoneura fumiferana defective polyhedrosis virus TaxID=74660 RepID=Q6VTV7_NPVCD|nr:hypothetical protein CFDNVgORF32 [Choristoneura fumiferana DEF multiple nucleopolyhedrovirus]AAQ91720.1 unknown [Choristoneura fumiferana DEF multiple nucleopolyhedrovirus]
MSSRPVTLYGGNQTQRNKLMPHKKVASLQALAFAHSCWHRKLVCLRAILVEQKLFTTMCLRWAEMYSDSVWIPHCVATTLWPGYINYDAVRTYVNYVASPNLPFVNGVGCVNVGHNCLKFVGILRMEHVNKLNEEILKKNWDLLFVQCFVPLLDEEFFRQLLQRCKRFGKCNLNKLIYYYYNKMCEI